MYHSPMHCGERMALVESREKDGRVMLGWDCRVCAYAPWERLDHAITRSQKEREEWKGAKVFAEAGANKKKGAK